MRIFRFLNSIVTHCLAVVALLFIGATIYETGMQWKKKREKEEAQETSEQ